MNDDQILERGGTQRDIEEYAKQNGGDSSHLPSLIESGIAEFDKAFPCIDANCDNNGVTWHVISGYDSYGEPAQEQEQLQCQYCHEVRFPYIESLKSFVTNIHNAAIESALEVLPKPYLEVALDAHKLHLKQWRNMVLEEARAKLSALKV